MLTKSEAVWRYLLTQPHGDSAAHTTVGRISQDLHLAPSTINKALSGPRNAGYVVSSRQSGIRLESPGGLQRYWNGRRRLVADIELALHVGKPVDEIEASLPEKMVLTAFSAARLRFGDGIGAYRQVWCYGSAAVARHLFPRAAEVDSVAEADLLVLRADALLGAISETFQKRVAPVCQIHADLSKIGAPEADVYLAALQVRAAALVKVRA